MSLNTSLFSLLVFCLIALASANYGYGTNPKSHTDPKSNTRDFLPAVFSVQGVIYCKLGPKAYPIKGGVVRITCLGVDKDGYEMSPFSILTRPTDANGYFLAKLSTKEADGCKISQCKAFLHSSPIKTCQFATNTNMGLTGAPLSVYRPIGSNNMRLYSLGPFVYDTVPKPTPTWY